MKFKIYRLLLLRMKQAYRLLSTVGWGLALVFIFATFGVFATMMGSVMTLDSKYAILFCASVILYIDLARSDKMFLGTIFRNKQGLTAYLFLEYLLIILPILIFQIISSHFSTVAGIISVVLLLSVIFPYYVVQNTSYSKRSIHIIPLQYFELKFYVEKFAWAWGLFWVLGFLTYFHVAFYVVWMFVIMISLGEIFRYAETSEMIHWKDRFVFSKFNNYSQLMLMLISIQSLLAVLMHFEYYQLIIYLIISALVVLLLNISTKYSLYEPLNRFHFGQNSVAIFTIISLLPGGIIITLIYSVYKFIKAEANLKYYYA